MKWGRNWSTRGKPPLNLNSLATFSHAPVRTRIGLVVRDSYKQYAVTCLSGPQKGQISVVSDFKMILIFHHE